MCLIFSCYIFYSIFQFYVTCPLGRWPRSLTSVAIPYEVTEPQQLNTDLFKVLPAFFFSLSFFCFCLFVCFVIREEIIVT